MWVRPHSLQTTTITKLLNYAYVSSLRSWRTGPSVARDSGAGSGSGCVVAFSKAAIHDNLICIDLGSVLTQTGKSSRWEGGRVCAGHVRAV